MDFAEKSCQRPNPDRFFFSRGNPVVDKATKLIEANPRRTQDISTSWKISRKMQNMIRRSMLRDSDSWRNMFFLHYNSSSFHSFRGVLFSPNQHEPRQNQPKNPLESWSSRLSSPFVDPKHDLSFWTGPFCDMAKSVLLNDLKAKVHVMEHLSWNGWARMSIAPILAYWQSNSLTVCYWKWP